MKHLRTRRHSDFRSFDRSVLGLAVVLFVVLTFSAGMSSPLATELCDPGDQCSFSAPDVAPDGIDFATSWVLVRLDEPLERRAAGDTFSITTGRPELDSAIAETGVHRIDYALTNAMRERRNPEALRRYGFDRTYKFHVAEGTDILAVVRRLSRLSMVEYAEPDFIMQPGVFPNDLLFPEQWYLDQSSDADIDAPEAWDITVGEDVLVAVVDTGGDSDHPDLVNKWEWGLGYDFIDDDYDPEDELGGTKSGHGTCVASIIAAETGNNEGMAGICLGCPLVPVRVFDQDGGGGTHSVVADGLVWAADTGAQVINYSGGSTGYNDILLGGVNYAVDSGVTLVTITHNDGLPTIRFPGEFLETIAVGGTNSVDQWWPNSNYGPRIDVVAPATAILCANAEGDYNYWTGTSFAAPQVSGLVGLMMSVDPSLGREEARHLARAGAEDEVGLPADDPPGFDHKHGWGRLNLERSLQGTQSSMSLRVAGRDSTRLYLDTANPLADSYDFIRGDLAALSEDWRGVDLGEVVCLENDSTDPDTTGNEDLETPAPGETFFYLARFNAAPGAGSYGGSSLNRDRLVIPPMIPAWTVESDQAGAQFSWSVSMAGDVNGDGYDDMIVGARSFDDVYAHEGRAYLYLGGPDGLDSTPAWTADGEQASAWFGSMVAAAGDVNNDGYDDVIIGASYFDNGQINEGRAYVYLGTATGLQDTAVWTQEGNQADAQFGYHVASAGDVNGDGYDDVIVATLYFDNGHTDEGKAWVYLGTSTGVADTHAWTVEGDQEKAWLGTSAAGVGDVNGDGYDDVVVGAPGYDNGETDEGRLLVYHGTGLGLSHAPSKTIELDVEDAWLGAWSVNAAGDVNCDGFGDVIATAGTFANGEFAEGAAFVFPGSSSGLEETPIWSFESNLRSTRLRLAAAAGNQNGDGCGDVIVGAMLHDSTRTDAGVAWVFFGSPSGPSEEPDWSVAGSQRQAKFGMIGARAGDVNADGWDDLVIGASQYDNGEIDEGRAYVYLGSASGLPQAAPSTDCDP